MLLYPGTAPDLWVSSYLSNYLAILSKLNTQLPKMCITLNNWILSTGESVENLGINICPHLNFFTFLKSIEHKISGLIVP